MARTKIVVAAVLSLGLAGCVTTGEVGTPRAKTERAIATMRNEVGTKPVKTKLPWCAIYMNQKLKEQGLPTTGSAMARSFTKWGKPQTGSPVAGDVMVTRLKGQDHVSMVLSDNGRSITAISGNHSNRVGIGDYPRGAVIALRAP